MKRYPTLFVSHGSPMFAVEPGEAGPLLSDLARRLPRPQAVLVVSPHWTTQGIAVSSAAFPATLHDFGGFPGELYHIEYPAPGHPAMAHAAAELLEAAGHRVTLDPARGLDHGAWVPLRHMYPAADVPMFQVSMPAVFDGASAWRLGAALAPLSSREVLIVGSGSLTHNLHEVFRGTGEEQSYATEFVEWVRDKVTTRGDDDLMHTLERAPHARRAHPTAEHFLPLLVAAGAAEPAAPAAVLHGGMTYGVLSMESYVFGR
jgi:4,5-DOPA dioxygenase extradiol